MRRTEEIAGTKAAEAKSRLPGAKKAVSALCGAAYLAVGAAPVTVLAAGAGAITQPLDNLKTLVISVIGAVGIIILAKNVMEFAPHTYVWVCLPAAGFFNHELGAQGNRSRSHDGGHFHGAYIPRLLSLHAAEKI